MINSLNSGVSGLLNFQRQLDVIGNNIANVDTASFKGSRVEFADAFNNTIRGSTPTSGTSSGTSAMQVGSGVTTASIVNSYGQQGTAEVTGSNTDLNISGAGYFVVRDPATNKQYVTRDGQFELRDGYLTTKNGMRVQGYSDSALATSGDIKIDYTDDGTTPHAFADDAKTIPITSVKTYSIDSSGKINVTLGDSANTQFVRGQVMLQNFSNPNGLIKEGNNLYSGMSSAGPLAATTAPGTNGTGAVVSGEYEGSNVDLTTQMADLITTQRAFQANSKIISTSDEVLQDVINLKR